MKRKCLPTQCLENHSRFFFFNKKKNRSSSKYKIFAFLKHRLQNKVDRQSARWISKGGKKILIKFIALVLLTLLCLTSCFLQIYVKDLRMPLHISSRVRILLKRALLGKMRKLCLPREECVIGFRMIDQFNLAILTKYVWRLLQFIDYFQLGFCAVSIVNLIHHCK